MVIEKVNKASVKNSIVENVVSMIINGRLSHADILPSIRLMSQRYGVSRSTVVMAYKELESLGYIEGKERSCYVVVRSGMAQSDEEASSPVLPDASPTGPIADIFAIADRLHRHENAMLPPHFIRTWCKDFNAPLHGKENNRGAAALNAHFVRYLKIARGIGAAQEEMLFINSHQEALALIVLEGKKRSLRPAVVLEDPCSPQVYHLFAALDYEIISVRVGAEGLEASALPQRPVDFICVSPSNHFPSGARMSAGNRQRLLAWCRRYEVTLIESDTGFTLGFAQEAVPPLCTAYPADNIVYLYNFAELTGYNASLCLVLAPPPLRRAIENRRRLLTSHVPWLGINMLGAFLGSPYLMKYLASTLQLRKEKYALAMAGLAQYLPQPAPWGLVHAGYFSFAATHGAEPFLHTFCYPLTLFCRQPPQAETPRYIYPVGTLTLQEIEKINGQLR